MSVMLRGDGGERHAKRHLAPKCGPVRKLVEFGPVELDGLLPTAKLWLIDRLIGLVGTRARQPTPQLHTWPLRLGGI